MSNKQIPFSKAIPLSINIHLEDLFEEGLAYNVLKNGKQEDVVRAYIKNDQFFTNILNRAKIAFEKVVELGGAMIRTDLSWYLYDPLSASGNEGWENAEYKSLTKKAWQQKVLEFFKSYVTEANNRKLECIIVLYKTPNWLIKQVNMKGGNKSKGKATNISKEAFMNGLYPELIKSDFIPIFDEYCKAVAETVGDKVYAFQIWNEPNNPMSNHLLQLGVDFQAERNSAILKDAFAIPVGSDDRGRATSFNDIMYRVVSDLLYLLGRQLKSNAALLLSANKTLRDNSVCKNYIINPMTDNDMKWLYWLEQLYEEMDGVQKSSMDGFKHNMDIIGIDLYPGTWLMDDEPDNYHTEKGWEALDEICKKIEDKESPLYNRRLAVLETGFSCVGARPTSGSNDENSQEKWINMRLPHFLYNPEYREKILFYNWYELYDSSNLRGAVEDLSSVGGVLGPIVAFFSKEGGFYLELAKYILNVEYYFGICLVNGTPRKGFNALQRVSYSNKIKLYDFKKALPAASDDYTFGQMPDNWSTIPLKGDFKGHGYDQALFIKRTIDGRGIEMKIVDFKAPGETPEVVFSLTNAETKIFNGWMAPNNHQLVGDFQGKGYDQVLFINRNEGGLMMIVDFKSMTQNIPAVTYWLEKTETKIFNGWLAPNNHQLVGDFQGKGYDQILFINRNESGLMMVVDFKTISQNIPAVTYWLEKAQTDMFNGWLMPNNHQLVGDFQGKGYDQVLFLNQNSSDLMMLVDFKTINQNIPAVTFRLNKSQTNVFNGWLGANNHQFAGDFRGLGHDQVLFLNKEGGARMMIFDLLSLNQNIPAVIFWLEKEQDIRFGYSYEYSHTSLSGKFYQKTNHCQLMFVT
jgi:beta-glucosidase/6-phospho-beta-glucosidase/beta-galactosidase